MIQYVVYKSPRDYPGNWVVRRWRIYRGKLVAYEHPDYVGPSLDEARKAVPPNLLPLARHPDDDPAVFEVWI